MRLRFGLAIMSLCVPYAVLGADTPPPGFTALLGQVDLGGWHGMIHFDPYKLDAMTPEERAAKFAEWTADAKQHWHFENGELVNDGNGAYLTTDKRYRDIELLIDYKTVPKADSGIYLRETPQVQIWDYTEAGGKWNLGAGKGSGGLWNNSAGKPGKDPTVLADKPLGEWNSFRILQVGERTTVYLNGVLVVGHSKMENFWNRKLPLRRDGAIQLQTHGGEIRWKNIFVREIAADEANKILAEHLSSGFEPAANGKDFTGWAGPIENYDVVDGVIRCKPGKGGVIHTKDELGDFVARVEYRLPPGGNNGLAIRYPGKGDGAYVGNCEIQILDDDSVKYAKLDARQYNGSIYGMVPAHRGYLRKQGDWNFMEVTVQGSSIAVELNGTKITEGDLSKITEFMNATPHPGKDLAKGHFGFCGHGDAVEFRNVKIKKL